MPPEEFVRGCDRRCCDSALNHRRPRRLLIWPHCDMATHSPTQLSCGIRLRTGSNWPASIQKLIQTQSNLETTFTGGFLLLMDAWGSKMSTTHISSRLSTSAHFWVPDSQGILLICFFNFTESLDFCYKRTCNFSKQQRLRCVLSPCR